MEIHHLGLRQMNPNPLPKSGVVTGLATLAVIAIGIFLRCQHMTDVTTRSPDERTYSHYAATLADEGLVGYRRLFAAYNADPHQWFYPSPSRFGFVFLSSIVMKATGVRSSGAGAAVSWFFSILSLFLLAWMGTRFCNPWAALFAVAFLSFSFSELGMARRAWQDSTVGFLGLLLVYLACEIVRTPMRRFPYLMFFTAGAFGILIKETAALSYGWCGIWLVGTFALRERSLKRVARLIAGGLASVAVALTVWTLVAGTPSAAISSAIHLMRAAGSNPYAAQAYSGPWHQFFYLLWIAGPLTALMALAGIVAAGIVDDHRAVALAATMTALFMLLGSFGPQLQNLRVISPSNGPYCLLAGLGLWWLLSSAAAYIRDYRAVLIVALLCLAVEGAHDYRAFTNIVVRSGMQDLAVTGIREVSGR